MNDAIIYFIEINLYLVCFYLLYEIILAKEKHFRFNRAFLLGGIFLSLTLPLISFSVNSNAVVEDSFQGYIILPAVTIATVQSEGAGFIVRWGHVFGLIYLAGFAVYLFRLIFQLVQISKPLLRKSTNKENKEGYTIINTNGEIPTCSFFNYLFWDKTAELNEEERNQILEHELVHIRQLHSLDILLIGLLRAIFWFNPFIHLIKSNITEVHEYLADHYATRQIDVEDYSKLLTLQIFKNYDFVISNNFDKSQVVKRIRMLRSNRSRSLWINLGLLVPVLAVLITFLAYDVSEGQSSKKEVASILEANVLDPMNNVNEVEGEIVEVAEVTPEPKGGMLEFYHYVQSNMKYPRTAKEQGIEGKVFVEFVVDRNGKLKNVRTVKGVGGGCDEEAERVIKNSDAWKPGYVDGQPVNVKMIMPITFKLG